MRRIFLRVRMAALAALCAALPAACSSSSPVEFDSEAAKGAKYEVSPILVDFGGSATKASVTLRNPTKRAMAWTASESAGWLALDETSGTVWSGSEQTLSLSASRAGLGPGTYHTEVTFSASNGGGVEVLTASITVPASGTSIGQLGVSPLQVDFGSTTTRQTMTLSNAGDASLTWTAGESATWLALGATSGTIPARSSQTLELFAQRDGMTEGSYTTAVTFSAGAAGSMTGSASLTVGPSSPGSWDPSDIVLSGQVIDQFEGLGMAGLSLQFNGSSTMTDADGRFEIPGNAVSSPEDLTLSGAAIHRRLTYAKTGDVLWGVVPASFDMKSFDDVARQDFGTATVRWVAPPIVYVDAKPEGFEDGPELQTWIAEVRVQATEFVSKWTGFTMEPADVIVTSNPPRDFSAGTIVIHFSEDASSYGNTASIGYARLSWSSSGSISGAAVWLRYVRYSGSSGASKRRGILGHELGHAMGLGHMDGTAQVSLMAPSLGSKTDLSPYDTRAATLLYGRSPGNTSPDTDAEDTDRSRRLLVPSGVPVETEWLCGSQSGIVSPDAPDESR